MDSTLFCLEEYFHASLFCSSSYPWKAFDALDDYLTECQEKPVDVSQFPGVHFVHPESIFLGKGVSIEPGCYIEGPCFIGEGSQVRFGAYIRGYVVTGSRCLIGHSTEIKRSILLNEVSTAHFNYVGNSILGNRVNLGAGVKCANLRLDRSEIKVQWKGTLVDTGLRKLGAIVGDGCAIGCNGVINPGTILGKGVVSFPNLTLHGFISEKRIVKS